MMNVSMNKEAKLSEHFSLAELCKTSYHTLDGNIPSHVAIENLRNLCENWLEDLRYSYNKLYQIRNEELEIRNCDYSAEEKEEEMPLIITSGYRSEEVNRLCGGAKGSNHLTGCAVDIRCIGPEHQIRMASILLDIADGSKREFDELILEKRGTTRWIHFAVRPKDNRRKILFDMR